MTSLIFGSTCLNCGMTSPYSKLRKEFPLISSHISTVESTRSWIYNVQSIKNVVGFFYDVYIVEMSSTIYIHYPKCATKIIEVVGVDVGDMTNSRKNRG